MICKTCETSLPDTANFCYICGKPVVEDVHLKPATLFFDLTAYLSGHVLIARTNSQEIADRVFVDLDRIVTHKECIDKRKEEDVWIVSYVAVPEGYDDLQMSRYFHHWVTFCDTNGWTARKPSHHSASELRFSYTKKQ